MNLKFIPLDYDYKEIESKSYMLIYGRTSDGKSCCVIDEAISFFYILAGNEEKAKSLIEKMKKAEIKNLEKAEIAEKNYLEKPVFAVKISCQHNKTHEVYEQIKEIDKNVET